MEAIPEALNHVWSLVAMRAKNRLGRVFCECVWHAAVEGGAWRVRDRPW